MDIFERALDEVGNDNKYQNRYNLIYHFVFIGIWGTVYMNIILALTITPHVCKVPGKPVNISEIEWKLLNIPRYIDVKGRYKFDSCQIYTNPYSNNNTEACNEYTYDTTWYDETAPSEYNWVCDKELNVVNILAYTKFGEVIGAAFFGWFSDRYGRRYTYIIAATMLFIGRSMSILAGNSYWLFFIGCMIAYFPSWTAPLAVSIIAIEMSAARKRTFFARLRFVAYSSGLFVMALIFWWIRNWKIFMIITTAPIIPFLLFSWKIIESPRWLYTQGRVKESLALLKKMAKVNNRKLQDKTEEDILSANSVDKPQVLGIIMLFSTKRLALNTILQLILWVEVTFSYMLLVLTSGDKTDSNPFLEFAWQSIIEIPAVYLGAWLADSIGRRYTAISSIGVTAAMWISIVFREISAEGWIRKWWVGSLFNIIAKLSTTVTFLLINILNLEFYPTCLRQTGSAVCNVVAGMCSGLIPYVIYLGRQYDARLPGIIMTIIALIGIAASFTLPETLNTKLPETLEEAQTFGSKQTNKHTDVLQPLKKQQSA